MSAFIVSKRHIDTLLTAAIYGTIGDHSHEYMKYFFWGEGPPSYVNTETAEDVGQMLWQANLKSVEHRYPYNSMSVVEPYEFIPLCLTPIEALKALRCYEYQSCEHPEWEASEAKSFCDTLRLHLISALPGYAEAPWEW